jgi:RES domain-containing protein
MIVYRLSRSTYANDLTGKGAERYGGRWNSKGTPLLYTSQSRALCALEIAVNTPLGIFPEDFVVIEIAIPDKSIAILKSNQLPLQWNAHPFGKGTQKIGDAFVRESKTLVLKVPSATVEGDFNFLINPLHSQISSIKIKSIKPFTFDHRLFSK